MITHFLWLGLNLEMAIKTRKKLVSNQDLAALVVITQISVCLRALVATDTGLISYMPDWWKTGWSLPSTPLWLSPSSHACWEITVWLNSTSYSVHCL